VQDLEVSEQDLEDLQISLKISLMIFSVPLGVPKDQDQQRAQI